jgi:hypothetical protein
MGPVVTLDQALAHFPRLAERRIILKIDAEGFEPEVIAGAISLLEARRIALIVWECGWNVQRGPGRNAMLKLTALLSEYGFRHFIPPGQATDGPLSEFTAEPGFVGNVFSCAAEINGVSEASILSIA